MKSWLSFTASSSASTIKICQTKNFAGSFGFYKNQRKQELLSVKGKNGKEKPLLHGCVGFHVAAVGAMLIQLKFQSDKLEVVMLSLAKMLDEYNNLYLTHLLLHTQYTRQNLHS